MAEKKKPPVETAAATEEALDASEPEAPPEKKGAGPTIVHMPVSDVADWDDDAKMKPYGPNPKWPMSGMSEDEARAAAKELPDPKGE